MRVAVTGASGAIGGQITRLLAADPRCAVVGLSRTRPALPDNVTWTGIDYAEADGLRAALRGVHTLVFVASDGPVAQVIVHHRNVIEAAAAGGVGHIVAMNGLDADVGSPFCYAAGFGYTEQLLRDSGCAMSIARASIYTEFFMSFLRRARKTGELRIPAGDGRISLVSRADVGRCLAALAVAGPTGRHHDITGPESLDAATIAFSTARRWSTPIKYVDVSPAEYCAELARDGEDPWWTYAFSSMFESVREQRWAAVSADVMQLTGQSPISLSAVLDENTRLRRDTRLRSPG
jgi:NAD(P)H dehydrogenase (quinone)